MAQPWWYAKLHANMRPLLHPCGYRMAAYSNEGTIRKASSTTWRN
jgi:hypothetical protein